MNETYILKENKSVTEIAKNIFGDIVCKVYYAGVHYGSIEEERVISTIDNEIKTAFNSDTSIDQDGRTIIIEFVNGRKVIFSNSEWGSMEIFNDSEINKIV